MKKYNKIFIMIMSTILIITGIIACFLICCRENLPTNIFDFLRKIIIVICLALIVLVLLSFCIEIIIIMKNGIHNISSSGDIFFERIDKYKEHWYESDKHFERLIQIINYYYDEGGEVDKLVERGEITRLYARLDFLEKNSSFYDTVMTYLHSMILSVIASFICKMLESNNTFFSLLWGTVVIITFFVILLFKYAKRGHEGDYGYFIVNYEQERLSSKIKSMQMNISIKEDDFDALETKQAVISELINVIKKTKNKTKRKQIIESIERLEELELCLEDYSDCYKKEIVTSKYKFVLVYDKEKGKINNYTGKINLKTNAYERLYEIIEQYGLINETKQLNKRRNKMSMRDTIRRFWLFEKMKILIFLISILTIFSYIYGLFINYSGEIQVLSIKNGIAIIYILSIILAILFAVIDYNGKKSNVNGLCFKVIEAYQIKEQYERFDTIRNCILAFKNREGECNIQRNVEVIEAAIAHDQALGAIFPIFITAISAAFFKEINFIFEEQIIIFVTALIVILVCYLLVLIPQNAFIKKVLENVRETEC